MDHLSVRLLRSGGIKAVTTATVALVALASSAVIARALDQTALGIYALMLAMVQIGTMLADGGTGMATTRFVASGRDDLDRRQATWSGLRARVLTTVCVIGIGALFMRLLLDVLYHHTVSAQAYWWALGWIAAKSLFLLAPAIARGRMNWLTEGSLLVIEAFAILGVYASLRWWPGDANALPLRMVAVYLLLLLPAQSSLRFARRHEGAPGSHRPNAVTVRRLLGFGLPLVLNSSFFLLLTWTDRIMIGIICSPEDLAVYFIAANLAGAGRLLFGIPEQVLYSHLAASSHSDDPGLPQVHIHLFRLFAALGALFVVAAGAVGIYAIPLLYGATYATSVWPFQLLLLVLLIRVISIPASLLLIVVFERTTETRDALALAFLVNIFVNLLLIPRLGVTGAILGSLAAFMTATGYLWWSLWKIARLRPGASELATFGIPALLWLAVIVTAHRELITPWATWAMHAVLVAYLSVVAMRQIFRLGALGRPKAVES